MVNLNRHRVVRLTEYYILKAPKKEFIVFEKSAHFPPFEESGKFNSLMINRILKEGTEYNMQDS